MPYCPKCDMEFVEGVTVCTDCGGPLVESKEAAKAMEREAAKKREELYRLQYEELARAESGEESLFAEGMEGAAAEGVPTENAEGLTAEGGEIRNGGSRVVKKKGYAGAYVDKKQRYEDMSSSASAFFFVGGVLAVAAVLCLAGIIPLPMGGTVRWLFEGMLAVLAAGSLAVAFSSKKTAETLRTEAAEEQEKTEEILSWFLDTYSAKDIDDRLLAEDAELSGEELALKRFELIQDYLITGRDLPDQSYADALCDKIYAGLYEEK